MAGSILLISDIHADAAALGQILGLAFSDGFSQRYGPVEKVLNLGDLLERGYSPKETVDLLRSIKCQVSILGNHDEAFLENQLLSGSDIQSTLAHERFRSSPDFEENYKSFFEDMRLVYKEEEAKIYAVHGGPIDPKTMVSGDQPPEETWLFSQMWQRISDSNFRYLDASGFHYLPEDAFEAMSGEFDGPGYVIVCGHEHAEAVFVERGGKIENALKRMKKTVVQMGGRDVEEKRLPLEVEACYLVRLGLAGPEGYAKILGSLDYHFGVLSLDPRELCLLSFKGDRQH